MSRAFDFSQLPKGGVTVLPNPATDIPVAGDVLAYLSTDAKGRILTEWRVGGSGGGGAGTVTSITAGGVLTGGTITTSGTIGLAVGTGIIANSGTISNAGVLSVGGSAGNVALGTGLVINTQTLAVKPATTVALGGISVGAGLAVDVNGVLTATGGSGSGGATIQPTPPAAAAGALWWDNTGGQLYIRYDDGNSQEWVAASAPAGAGGAGFVPSAGGTMTGPLVLSGDATANLNPVPLRQLNTTLTAYALTSTVPPPSSSLPLMDSIAAIGSAANFARADHIHPTDTSRAATSAIPVASVTNPLMDGAVAIGSSLNWAKADHVHPVDTSRAAQTSLANYVLKAGDTMTDTLTLGSVNDPLNISVAAGQSARFMATRPGRQWSCGQVSTGTFAIADETAGKAIMSFPAGGTSVGIAGSLTVSVDAVITGSMSCGTATVVNGSLSMQKGSASNPAIYYHDGTTNRTIFYFDITNGRSQMTDVYSGSALYLDPAGNFTYNGGGGVAYKTGGGTWTAPSDARIKTVLEAYAPGLQEVLALKPIRYVYKGNDTDGSKDPEGKDSPSPRAAVARDKKAFVGLVAQEVEAIFPGMVTKRAGFLDGEPVTDLRDLDTSELVYALVNAVKTLNTRLAALEAPNGA